MMEKNGRDVTDIKDNTIEKEGAVAMYECPVCGAKCKLSFTFCPTCGFSVKKKSEFFDM